MKNKVTVVGAGLAGCEAAWSLANAGISVKLCEMKPQKFSPAHSSAGFAELVCSNSLKAARIESASGLLKAEMRLLGSLLLCCADCCAVPAGGALAVDRGEFSRLVTEKIGSHTLIEIVREEVETVPGGDVIIATGPLTSETLANDIRRLCGGEDFLHFFDAAAPIITVDSIDKSRAFTASRYGRGGEDYWNCPFNKEEYDAFYDALIAAESARIHDFDRVYEGCMPVEVLAKRGRDSMRFGPLKPVGLRDPKTGRRPWAVAQLRLENVEGTLLNLVGFQTNLRFPEQERVFRMIPGLENAEFARFGVMHRNTFLQSPHLLNADFSLRAEPRIFFAGQITGVEGYMESAAGGIIAAIQMARRLNGKPPLDLPEETMTGSLVRYITAENSDFQPMGANMGILPALPVKIRDKQERYRALAERALAALAAVL